MSGSNSDSDSRSCSSNSYDKWKDDHHGSDSDSYSSDDDDKSNDSENREWDDEEQEPEDNDDQVDEEHKRLSDSPTDCDQSMSSHGSYGTYDEKKREEEVKKSKWVAIVLTAICVIVLILAITMGVVMFLKKSKKKEGNGPGVDTSGLNITSDMISAPATPIPVVTDGNATQTPTITATDAPSLSPTLAPISPQPTLIVIEGESSLINGDDDFFSMGDDTNQNVEEDEAIPPNLEITSNGDSSYMTRMDAKPLDTDEGLPLGYYGSTMSLLVQSMNTFDPLADNNFDIDATYAPTTEASLDGSDEGSTEGSIPINEDGESEEEESSGTSGINEQSSTMANKFVNSYALLNFYLGDYPWYQKNSDLTGHKVNAYMCLQHIPDTSPKDLWGNPQFDEEGNEIKKVFSICRVQNRVPEKKKGKNDTAERDAATGSDVEKGLGDRYRMPENCLDGKVDDFFVAPSDTTVCVDISSYIQNYPPFVAEKENRPKSYLRRRFLQSEDDDETFSTGTIIPTEVQEEDAETIVDKSNFKNLLFMIANIKEDQDASARFYSRQSVMNATQLFITLEEVTESPTTTPYPTAPTSGPTESPTQLLPTDSPTQRPSLSPIEKGTMSPSPAPTFESKYEPCGICGDYKIFEPLKDLTLGIPNDIAPPQLADGKADCNLVETTCQDGHCSPQLCKSISMAKDFCGCQRPEFTPCNICPGNETLISPESEVFLEWYEAPMGKDGKLTCRQYEASCQAGFCDADVCTSSTYNYKCACTSDPFSSENPMDESLTTMAPTETVTVLPTTTPNPTFEANFESCSICGGDLMNFPLTDQIVELPGDLTPPQVSNNLTTCEKLESYCEGGYCSPIMCQSFQESLSEICGCFGANNTTNMYNSTIPPSSFGSFGSIDEDKTGNFDPTNSEDNQGQSDGTVPPTGLASMNSSNGSEDTIAIINDSEDLIFDQDAGTGNYTTDFGTGMPKEGTDAPMMSTEVPGVPINGTEIPLMNSTEVPMANGTMLPTMYGSLPDFDDFGTLNPSTGGTGDDGLDAS